MNCIILNEEGKQIVGYRLKTYKKMQTLQTKLIYDSPHKHVKRESIYFMNMEGDVIEDGNKIIKHFLYTDTGKIQSYNDFYSQDQSIYMLDYDVYTLPELYKVLARLEKGEYEKLEDLNKLYEKNLVEEKYQKLLNQSFSFQQLFSYNTEQLKELRQLLLLHMGKKEFAKKEEQIEKIIKVYQMNVSSIPKRNLKKE